MIAIVNTGKVDALGFHEYTLQINKRILTTFHHKRDQGLSTCLQRAAGAAMIFELAEDLSEDDIKIDKV